VVLLSYLLAVACAVDLVRCGGTLVVCPASLMLQWESEIKSKFEAGTMKVLIYHGQSRTKDPRTCVDVGF